MPVTRMRQRSRRFMLTFIGTALTLAAALPHCAYASDLDVAVATPIEPDYEEEKLQFQRGSLMYYTLPELDKRWPEATQKSGTAMPQDLLTRAGSGEVRAQYLAGELARRPAQGRADFSRARYWLLQAAAQRDAAAMVSLGLMSERGNGIEQDYRQARLWYEQAAASGSGQAQFMLGLIYHQGKGVPQDPAQARYWMSLAANRNVTAAQVDAGWLSEYGVGSAQDNSAALMWYAKAARQGDVLGEFNLGTLYYQGKGVEKDNVKARYWFEQAAEKNAAGAQYNLGVMALGQGQKRDPVIAYQWFRLVQLAGYPGANQSVRSVMPELSPVELAHAELHVRQWQSAHANGRIDRDGRNAAIIPATK